MVVLSVLGNIEKAHYFHWHQLENSADMMPSDFFRDKRKESSTSQKEGMPCPRPSGVNYGGNPGISFQDPARASDLWAGFL